MSWFGAGWRRGGLIAVLVLMLAWPAEAQARLSWSGPVFLNEGASNLLSGVACPAVSQCTAVDGSNEVTFNPAAPRDWSAYAIDSRTMSTVACPDLGECVAVDDHGREVTFDPQRIGSAHTHVISSGRALESVACPSDSQCTAADSTGGVVTFDPLSGASSTRTSLSSAELAGIACPSAAQCTVIVGDSTSTGLPVGSPRLVTFDPSAPATGMRSLTVTGLGGDLACPTTSRCVAIAFPSSCISSCDEGGTVTFDPESSAIPTFTSRNPNGFFRITCPSATQCTAMDAAGYQSTFDPTTSAAASHTFIDPFGDYPKGINWSEIACPSVSKCTAVSLTFPGSHEMTFDPQAPSTPVPALIDDGAPVVGVSCPSGRECVVLAEVDNFYLPYRSGTTTTIDPRSGSSPGALWSLGGPPIGLSCPTSTQCTVVLGRGLHCAGSTCRFKGGLEATFNPLRRRGQLFKRGQQIDGRSLTGVSCPSATECVAIDIRGDALTFNPRHVGKPERQSLASADLTAIDCNSRAECVAVDSAGQAITLDPQAKSAARMRFRIDGHRALAGLACPSARQCTAVDAAGSEVTFNPLTGVIRSHHRISGGRLTGISCLATGGCVAIDSKQVLTGDPRTRAPWHRSSLLGASPLTAIACRPHGRCVVADADGHAYFGRS